MFDIQFIPLFVFILIIVAFLWNQNKKKGDSSTQTHSQTVSLKFRVRDDTEANTITDIRRLSGIVYSGLDINIPNDTHSLQDIQVNRLFQGATNKCYEIKRDGFQSLFIRVEGKGNFLSVEKSQEMHILQLCSRHNLSPKLYSIYTNGYISEFINGEFISVPMMADPKYSNLIALSIAKWHKLQVPSNMKGKLDANVWKTIDRYLVIAKQHYSQDDPILNMIEMETNITKNDIMNHSRTDEFVLCHNDLNHGNIAYDGEKDSIIYVDLEFGGLNYRNFDLANHFCEWAGLDLRYELCPTEDQQKRFLRTYVDAHYGDKIKNKDQYVNWMYIETYKWMQVSHLVWILWGIIQEKISDIVDFNYHDYWKVRLTEYHKRKGTSLNMTYVK